MWHHRGNDGCTPQSQRVGQGSELFFSSSCRTRVTWRPSAEDLTVVKSAEYVVTCAHTHTRTRIRFIVSLMCVLPGVLTLKHPITTSFNTAPDPFLSPPVPSRLLSSSSPSRPEQPCASAHVSAHWSPSLRTVRARPVLPVYHGASVITWSSKCWWCPALFYEYSSATAKTSVTPWTGLDWTILDFLWRSAVRPETFK